MHFLIEKTVFCPYCGEPIEVLLDNQDAGDHYIEDCQVCCKPIVFKLSENQAGEFELEVFTDNDVI